MAAILFVAFVLLVLVVLVGSAIISFPSLRTGIGWIAGVGFAIVLFISLKSSFNLLPADKYGNVDYQLIFAEATSFEWLTFIVVLIITCAASFVIEEIAINVPKRLWALFSLLASFSSSSVLGHILFFRTYSSLLFSAFAGLILGVLLYIAIFSALPGED